MKIPKLMNIEKYVLKHQPDIASFASTFSGNIISGMFNFGESDASMFCSPWGKTGVIMLIDENHEELEDYKGYSSKNFPFLVYLAGTDDTSFSKSFATLSEAYDCANLIIKTPTSDHLYDLGFVFTN